MDIRVGDILTMKKPHPCGCRDWAVLRVGADFRLRCCGCGRELLGPRAKFEKSLRQVKRPAESGPEPAPARSPLREEKEQS